MPIRRPGINIVNFPRGPVLENDVINDAAFAAESETRAPSQWSVKKALPAHTFLYEGGRDGRAYMEDWQNRTPGQWAYNYALVAVEGGTRATELGQGEFAECVSLLSVHFPAVNDIGVGCFTDCNGLRYASFPAATHIEFGAFVSTNLLEEFYAPSLIVIGENVFFNSGLRSAVFPRLNSLGDFSFTQCPNLFECVLPSLATLGNAAFGGAESLTQVHLGCPLSGLHSSALLGSSVDTIYVPAGTPGWTFGQGQTIASKSDVQVLPWLNWPNA